MTAESTDGVTLWPKSVTGRSLSPAARPGFHAGRKPANAGKRYRIDLLTPAEVGALLDACGNSMSGARNRALITLLYRAGLRLGEALQLAPADVDLARGTVTVLRGKGGKRRLCAVDPDAAPIIDQWLRVRHRLNPGEGTPLFCTMACGRMSPSYVRTLLPRLAAAAGIEKRVHAHGLRHSHASELAREGIPPHLIQRQLGHSSLATTDVYLRGISSEELVSTIGQRRWSA